MTENKEDNKIEKAGSLFDNRDWAFLLISILFSILVIGVYLFESGYFSNSKAEQKLDNTQKNLLNCALLRQKLK